MFDKNKSEELPGIVVDGWKRSEAQGGGHQESRLFWGDADGVYDILDRLTRMLRMIRAAESDALASEQSEPPTTTRCVLLGLSDLILECCTGPRGALPTMNLHLSVSGPKGGIKVDYSLECLDYAMSSAARLKSTMAKRVSMLGSKPMSVAVLLECWRSVVSETEQSLTQSAGAIRHGAQLG